MSRWVLVTGSAKRIGRAIALELAAHGWDIVVHYNKSAKEAQKLAEEIQEMGRSACLAEIDLGNAAMAERLIPSLTKELGAINALINNASLFEPDKMDPDGSRHWAVNAEAPRILGKSFRDCLPKGERGIIINLLDATPMPSTFSAYDKSKKFLSKMTLNMAKSFGPKIRVNGVAPGHVDTEGVRSDFEMGKLDFEHLTGAIPARRIADVSDVANAVLFLSSEQSRHVVGATLTIDGGEAL